MANKSAKDLAFDRERARYGKRIKELENLLKERDRRITELNGRILEIENERDSLQDWVNRLLEYTELSEEDLKVVVQKDKDSAEVASNLKTMFSAMKRFGFGY